MELMNRFFLRINSKVALISLDQALLSGTSFVLNVLLIRFLSIEEFGIYVIIFSFLLLASSVHGSLITAPVAVIVSKMNDTKARRYVGNLNYSQMALSLFIALIMYIASVVFVLFELLSEYQEGLSYLSFVCFFYLGQLYIRSVLLSRLRMLAVLQNDALYVLTQLLIVIFLIGNDKLSVNSAILAIGLSALISYIFGVYQCVDFISYKQVSLKQGSKVNFEHGRWLLGAALVTWIRTNILNYIALYFVGPIAPAVLRATQTIYGPINLILVSVESFIPQMLSKAYSSLGVVGLSSLMRKFTVILFLGVMFYCLIVSLFAGELLLNVYGEKYLGYESIVWVLAIQYIFIVFQTVNSIALRVLDVTSKIFTISILEAFITILPGLLLVYFFGLEGAIIWKLLSTVLLASMTYFIYLKSIGSNLSFRGSSK